MITLNFIVYISNLSFKTEFEINHTVEREDYFVFKSNQSSAHLSRINETVVLYLSSADEYQSYKTILTEYTSFEFEWEKHFRVNNKNMMLNKGSSSISNLQFDSFMFYSVNVPMKNCDIISCIDVNYALIAAIVIAVGLFIVIVVQRK